jgi:dTMP kinase
VRASPRSLSGRDGAAGDITKDGQTKVDGCGPPCPLVQLGEFLFSSGEADLEALDFAEPALSFGLGDAIAKIVADLDDSLTLCGIRPQKTASQATVFVDAARAVGTAAVAQGDSPQLEVAEEFLPFLFGGCAVFIAGAGGAASCNEGAVALDDFFGVDGFVAHGGVDVAVADDELGDVWWHRVEPSHATLGRLARYRTDAYHGHTLACLVAADRYHHLATEIRPALAAGKIVLCDRYVASSYVLQRLDGVPMDFIEALNADADRPDLAIILTADPIATAERIAHRGAHTRFETDPDLHQREVDLYRDTAIRLAAAGYQLLTVDSTAQRPDRIVEHLGPRIASLAQQVGRPPAA